jgi:hypothetical protein
MNNKFEEWYRKNRLDIGEMPRWMEEQIREHYQTKWDMARTGMIDENDLIPGTNATFGEALEMFKGMVDALEKYGNPNNYWEHVEYPHYVINGHDRETYPCTDMDPGDAVRALTTKSGKRIEVIK